MDGLFKKLLYVVIGIVAVLAIAAIVVSFLIDPNVYRGRIEEAVRNETGRDLVIEGDLDLSFFPWLGLDVGRTTLGNARGFGDEPFLSFDQARLNIKVLPLIRGDGLHIGAVVLDSFQLDLAVNEDGRNNWQDIQEHEPPDATETSDGSDVGTEIAEEAAQEQDITLNIASIEITDAAVSYRDEQAGERYSLTNFNLSTGPIAGQDPVDIRSRFDFSAQPANLAGDVSIETTLLPVEDGVTLGDTRISAVGIDAMLTGVGAGEGFHVQVDAFSLKSLMTRLGIEPPVTADPEALGKVLFEGDIRYDDDGISVTEVELVVDDTAFTGDLAVASDEAGTISVNLAGDSIDLGRYMEPAADPAEGGGDTVPVEIPAELIRALNVRGNMTLDTAVLSGLVFDDVELGLVAADGRLRMHPIAAGFFDGRYEGDVRIDASGNVPSLSVNENIRGVSLGAMAKSVFDQDDITGTINGSFRLGGSGADLGAIQRDLDGSITMELTDGAWEGTDIWYELRRARALLRNETPPEPTLPMRTAFSNVRIAGPVNDGVFSNDELFAELPFMQLTGSGTVNLPTTKVDYRLAARFLDKPEFASNATPAELDDFTKAEIPVRITGTLTEPKIAPDIEGYLEQEVQKRIEEEVQKKVEDEIKDKVLDRLFRRDD
jgi:AsmA protein